MLEAFSKLGSDKVTISRGAGSEIYAQVVTNSSELEYAVTRLVRGLESHKVSTRTGSYSTLATFLGLKHLKPSQLREIVGKTLITDQTTSKKERRLVYIARILACGAILRVVPFPQLLSDDTLFKGVLGDLVELGQKRSTLLELAAPFLCSVLGSKNMTSAVFEEVLWPAIVPLFASMEVKTEKMKAETENGEDVEDGIVVEAAGEETDEKDSRAASAILLIALTCYDKGLRTEFEFLSDIDRVVRILLGHRIANVSQVVELLVKYVKNQGLAEAFWNSLLTHMRSSHFETICVCVQKSVEAGIHQSLMVRKELVTPLLGVFRNDEAPEQHATAVKTLGSLLKWNTKEDEKMGKKERKSVIKSLFGGSPNLLHEYQKLLRIITPFLVEVCSGKDLIVLESVIGKHFNSESNVSLRMCIVYIQFLSRIAQCKKATPELKLGIGKRILSIAFGKEVPNLIKPADKTNGMTENGETEPETKPAVDNESLQHVSKSCMESFKSLIASSYSPQFLEEILAFVNEDLDSFCKEKSVKKLFKKAEKQRNKSVDVHLKYILGSYAIRLLLEQDKVLGEAQTYLEELLEVAKSNSGDASLGIIEFYLSTVTKDEQPPFDFESLFSRLVIEVKISEDIISKFADVIDVEINEGHEDEDDSDSDEEEDDDDEDKDEKMDVEDGEEQDEDDSDEDQEEKPTGKKLPKGPPKSKTTEKVDTGDDDDGSDSDDSCIDMDDATEADLQNMDKALAKVFATKKKVKEEETSEVRSLMRTFRLLETLLNRNAKVCPVIIPLMLLMPIVHSLQHACRGKKSNNSLSTRIVSVLNKLNGIKKIEGVESVEQGTFLTMSRDLVELTKQGKNRLIGDLLGDSVVMLTKCYLQGSRRTNGEDVGFLTLYTGLLDLQDDTRNKSMGVSSNLISSALTTLPNWEDGKDAIVKRIISIIFNPDVRHFRRMQFLILFRAAISDKCGTSPELSKWKLSAMKELTRVAASYFATDTNNKEKNITKELLLTLSDPSTASDPELCSVLEKFFKKLYKDNPTASSTEAMKVLRTMANSQPQLKKLFVQIGLQDTSMTPKGKRKSVATMNGNSPSSTTPKVAVGSKRKSERINGRSGHQLLTPTSGVTPSKKMKTRQLR